MQVRNVYHVDRKLLSRSRHAFQQFFPTQVHGVVFCQRKYYHSTLREHSPLVTVISATYLYAVEIVNHLFPCTSHPVTNATKQTSKGPQIVMFMRVEAKVVMFTQ